MNIFIKKNLFFSNKKRPLIIAEISGNHNGKFNNFKKGVLSASKNGADLVKIQTYEASDIVLKNINYKIKKGLWSNKNLWNLYQAAQTPFSWHKDIFDMAKKNKITLFSSPFSTRGVELLEKLNVPIYKIASFEITDIKLIRCVASTKKPLIISTGCCTFRELEIAIKEINKFHNKIIIMHCESGYPTEIKDSKINKITFLKSKFNKNLIGLSDHTRGIASSLAATALNAVCIEKHYNYKDIKTVDSEFSIGPDELRHLRKFSEEIFESINSRVDFLNEKKNSDFKRSIYVIKNILKGERFSEKNISTFRPKIGVCASNFFKIIGKKSTKNLQENKPLYSNDISKS